MTQSEKRMYWIWSAMIQRCTNPRNPGFKNYGARGIKVCERWLTFANFLTDMGERPAGKSLDRIDNDGHYEQSNCRWNDRKSQNSNRRYCIRVSDGSEVVTLKEFCRRHSLSYRPIVKRIKDRGWSIQDALSIPVGARPHSYSKRVSA